jgi:cation diffusion facilitator family transporter
MMRPALARYAWLSIGAALLTIGLKTFAYWLTGSVGLLSDALESIVNLVGACIALVMLTIAARPADEDHLYGHSKAEYFSSGAEGVLILIAAISIATTAIRRFTDPQPIEQVGLGLAVSVGASLVNLAVARVLLQAGRRFDSITLEADARHLMTDVWTSVGVIVAVGAVAVTGWQRLDPMIALVVAANILWSGFRLAQRSVAGLMDVALPAEEQAVIQALLATYQAQGIEVHRVRTRQAAARRFISMHVLVPGEWTVREAHRRLEQLEAGLRQALPGASIDTHLEPAGDPSALNDVE